MDAPRAPELPVLAGEGAGSDQEGEGRMSKILFLDLDLEGIANLYAEWCSEMDRDDCCTERTLADAVPALIARVRELEARLSTLRDSARDAMDSHSEAARDAIDDATRAERERCLAAVYLVANRMRPPDLMGRQWVMEACKRIAELIKEGE
jgi:hypothetical protein